MHYAPKKKKEVHLFPRILVDRKLISFTHRCCPFNQRLHNRYANHAVMQRQSDEHATMKNAEFIHPCTKMASRTAGKSTPRKSAPRFGPAPFIHHFISDYLSDPCLFFTNFPILCPGIPSSSFLHATHIRTPQLLQVYQVRVGVSDL
jgi:hypothetical protein